MQRSDVAAGHHATQRPLEQNHPPAYLRQMDSGPTLDVSRPDRRGAFLLLFFCLLAVGAGNTMLTSAVLPPLTRELGLPDWTAGAIFSLSAAVWVVTAPYWGAKSNIWGRRRVAAIGMIGFAASMFFFALVSFLALMNWISDWMLVFVLLLVARTLFGVFGSATNPAAQAYVADRTSREERMNELSTLTSGFTLGQMAGPAAAAVLITAGAIFSPAIGLLLPLVVVTIIATAIGAIVLFRLPETRAPRAEGGIAKTGTKGLWRHPAVFPFLLYAVGLSLITGVLSQTFPYAIMDRMNAPGAASAQFTGPAMTMGAMATLISQLVLIPRMRLSVRLRWPRFSWCGRRTSRYSPSRRSCSAWGRVFPGRAFPWAYRSPPRKISRATLRASSPQPTAWASSSRRCSASGCTRMSRVRAPSSSARFWLS